MIKSFYDKKTRFIYEGFRVKGFAVDLQIRAHRKILLVDNAINVDDLRASPGN